MTAPSAAAPLTLSDLHTIPVTALKGIGPKKADGLEELGVTTVARPSHLLPAALGRPHEQSPRIGDLSRRFRRRSSSSRSDRRTKTTTRTRKQMVTVETGDESGRLRLVFFNQAWRERQLAGLQVALFGQARRVPGPAADDEPGRRPHRRPHRPHRAGVPAVREGPPHDVGHRGLGGRRGARPGRGFADPFPTRCSSGSTSSTGRARSGHPRDPRSMDEQDAAPAAGSCSTSCCASSSRSSCASARSSGTAAGIRHDGRRRARAARSMRGCRTSSPARRRGSSTRSSATSPAATRCTGCCKATSAAARPSSPSRALLVAVQGGHQGALMAPTEVLAEQHALGVRALLDGFEVPARPTLSRRSAAASRAAHEPHHRGRAASHAAGLVDGEVDLLIGTHALIQEGVRVPLARGRRDRRAASIRGRAAGHAARRRARRRCVPDVLVMTATPIPRTAAMTVYGDLDVSRPRRDAAGAHADRDTRWCAGELDGRARCGRQVRERGRRRASGVRRVPAHRGVREARGARRRRRHTSELQATSCRACASALLHGRMPSGRQGGDDGRVPRRRDRRAGRDDRDRGGRRRAQRHGHGHPRRRPVRHRAAAPAARPGRAGPRPRRGAGWSAPAPAEAPRPGSRRW